jgi:hypothetical protein
VATLMIFKGNICLDSGYTEDFYGKYIFRTVATLSIFMGNICLDSGYDEDFYGKYMFTQCLH